MLTGLIVCLVAGLYLAIMAAILRLTTRMVTGVYPTLTSAIGTILVAGFLSLVVTLITRATDLDEGRFHIPAVIGSFVLNILVYTVTIRDTGGSGVSFMQAVAVTLFQIPIVIGVFFVLAFLVTAGGLSLATLVSPEELPWTKSNPAALSRPAAFSRPAPPPATPGTRWGTLAQPVNLPTKYGHVTYSAGSQVEILREISTGYIVRMHGAEFSTTREQVVPRR